MVTANRLTAEEVKALDAFTDTDFWKSLVDFGRVLSDASISITSRRELYSGQIDVIYESEVVRKILQEGCYSEEVRDKIGEQKCSFRFIDESVFIVEVQFIRGKENRHQSAFCSQSYFEVKFRIKILKLKLGKLAFSIETIELTDSTGNRQLTNTSSLSTELRTIKERLMPFKGPNNWEPIFSSPSAPGMSGYNGDYSCLNCGSYCGH